MRTHTRALAGTAALLTAAVLVLVGGSSALSAAPGAPQARGEATARPPGDDVRTKIKDNRTGQLAPTSRQRDRAAAVKARVRWNALGTPAVLASTGAPLATGLSRDAATAAREYVAANQELLGLTPRGAAALELLSVAPMGSGSAVIFQQRFGGLPAGVDGILSIGIRNGAVWHVSSSLARDGAAPEAATLSKADAERIALGDAGVSGGSIARTQLVAVPTADRGVRAAYQVVLGANLSGADPIAYSTYVDAGDGSILVRENLVDSDSDNPEWDVFENSPPLNYSSTDTRVRWCFFAGSGCDEVVGTLASRIAWDVDPATGLPTNTTNGNNAIGVHNWNSNDPFSVGTETATASPTRDYTYAYTNQWFEESCNPDTTFTSPQRNDIDAARANLFAMHNRMHDWSYHLGFKENLFNMQRDNAGLGGLGNDPEQGNAQAGGISGGPPGFQARDNANQITGPDGVAPITNMYLWQPIAGAFYSPCVDGDFDMSVIGHEYGHAITNRMIAGPNGGLSSPQGMSESWSDLMAVEYLFEHGYSPPGALAFTIGPYVTQDQVAGIRNYNMSNSPLNYSSLDYDFVGLQVHASGEVWSATNFDIRAALIKKYGAGNAALQKACANGLRSVLDCPGNRRWAQLMFDSFPLMAVSQVSMVDARDALLAADMIRFGGANLPLLWDAFAKRGLGEGASSNGNADPNPVPSFSSPFANEATVTFQPVNENGGAVVGAKLYVGDYQARAMAVADSDVATPLSNQVRLVPGTYEFIVHAPGRGHVRVGPVTYKAGQAKFLNVTMRQNLASATAGAVVSGDGINLARLVDDDEATNWASLDSPVAGKQVTVDLAGGMSQIRRIQVSAQLRPQIATDPDGAASEPVLGPAPVPCPRMRGQGCSDLRQRGRFPSHLHQSSRRLPIGRTAAAGAGADHQLVQRPADEGDTSENRGGNQPVHGWPGLRRRAGCRPAGQHRLHDGERSSQ